MIDFAKTAIAGTFPVIGKPMAVTHRPGQTSHGYTAVSDRLFGDGADYRLHLRNFKSGGQLLECEFCPPKINQGHNGLGSNDLRGVVSHAVKLILRDRDIPVSRQLDRRLQEGDYTLRAVHIAELHRMPHEAIPALCRSIRRQGSDSLQAVPIGRGIGVRLWPNSRSRQLLIYDKVHYYLDVTARTPFKHHEILQAGLQPGSWPYLWQGQHMSNLMEYLQQGVRIEVRLLADFLKRRKLDRASAWTKQVAQDVYQEVLAEVPLGGSVLASAVDRAIATEPLPLKTLLVAWAAGYDPAAFSTSPATFYRHAKLIKVRFGIDISLPPTQLPGSINWTDLIKLEAIVERAPEWARGDGFFFNPRHPDRASARRRI